MNEMDKETSENLNPSGDSVNSENGKHCKHFVKRKKRFCKMTLKVGYDYCGEHLPANSPSSTEEHQTLRVVCPLDGKHTCFAHKLQKHLKICNARPTAQPYILKGVNCGEIQPEAPSIGPILNARQLSTVKVGAIKVLVEKINKIYAEHVEGNILDCFEKSNIVETEIAKPEYGDKTKKHLIQASAILGILEAKRLLQSDTCYIEFGAGKGQLSYWMSQAIEQWSGSSVLLVERASHRHKMDNKIDKCKNAVHRIKVDIGDLLLHQVDIIKASKGGIVGVTKHLCGDATDLAMRCMENYAQQGGHVVGLAMAFCCHHRCQWSAYVGKEFFNSCDLTRDDFDIICGMVSWAICGTGLGRDKTSATSALEPNQRDKEIGLTRDAKEDIGRKCKNLLNYGRLVYLQHIGFDCSLNYYVPSNISPENVCIIATKRQNT